MLDSCRAHGSIISVAMDYTPSSEQSLCLASGKILLQALCTAPTSQTGYNFAGAGGTVTITGFSPSGVTCASGYTGTVSYTACATAGSDYSVSGCQAGVEGHAATERGVPLVLAAIMAVSHVSSVHHQCILNTKCTK